MQSAQACTCDANATAMLIEESTAPPTELLIRWVQLPDGSKERHHTLMGDEVQEPDEVPIQASGIEYTAKVNATWS